MVSPYLITVAGFHFPDRIPILLSPCERSDPITPGWQESTQLNPTLGSPALGHQGTLHNTSPTQQLSYVQAVRRDRRCHPCPTPCHHPPSPLLAWVLLWHLHLRHNLSLLNFCSPVQRSSSMDLTMAMQGVWSPPPGPHVLPPCLTGQQILDAATDICNPAPGSAQHTFTMAASPPPLHHSSSLSTIITLFFKESEREKTKENSPHRNKKKQKT